MINKEETDRKLEEIARDVLKIRILRSQGLDSLDFHDVAVWKLQEALRAAFEAGRKTRKKSKSP